MGRGLGPIQQSVLDSLASGGKTYAQLATEIHGPSYTAAELNSVGRAIRALESAGSVVTTWESIGTKEVLRPVGRRGASGDGLPLTHLQRVEVAVPGKVVYLQRQDELPPWGSHA